MFFGEVRRSCSVHVSQGWAWSNNGNGHMSTIIPLNYDSCEPAGSSAPACNQLCNWSTEFGFKSQHPGGSMFVLGDGSVHFLSEAIDHQNYQYLGAKADGEIASLP